MHEYKTGIQVGVIWDRKGPVRVALFEIESEVGEMKSSIIDERWAVRPNMHF